MPSAKLLCLVSFLAAALALPANGGDPRLEWGPADGSWKVLTEYSMEQANGPGQTTSSSGSAAARVGLARSFVGEGYEGGGHDGPLVEFDVFDRPIRTKAECEAMISPRQKNLFGNIACTETTFHGLRAVRFEGSGGQALGQYWMDVEISTRPPKTLRITTEIYAQNPDSWERSHRRVAELLATFQIFTDAPPKAVWQVDIRVPRNLKPGDALSPEAVITDQYGNEPTGLVQVRWFFDGDWGSSITWNGSRTEIEAQVSVEGQAVIAHGVVPEWQPQEESPPPQVTPSSRPPPSAEPPSSAPTDVPETTPPGPSTDVPGFGGIGRVPGPRTLVEGVVSVLGPAAIGLIGALLTGLVGGGPVPPPLPPQPPRAPTRKRPPAQPPKPRKKPDTDESDPPETDDPKKKPVADTPKKKKTKAKRPTKEQVAESKKKAEQATKEAAEANSILGRLVATMSNAKKEIQEAASTVNEAVGKGAKIAAKGIQKLLKDPRGTIKEVGDATKDAVEKGTKLAVDTAKAAGKAGLRIAKEAYNDPQAALEKLKKGAAGLYSSLKDFISDPKKVWSAFKEATGIDNFGNAIDPNRSLLERIGQVGVGVSKLYGTITTTRALANVVKNGGSAVIKAAKNRFGKKRLKLPSKAERRRLTRLLIRERKHQRALGGKASAIKEIAGPVDLSDFTPDEIKYFEAIAHKHGVRIHIRPRGKIARDLIKNGKALPKPEMIKAKTIGELDTYLGYPKNARGMVACKPPVMPGKRPPGMNGSTWKKLQDRCAQRTQEFRDQASKLSKLERKGEIYWDRKTGIVYNKNRRGLPFTGDHDGFSFTDPNDHSISPWVREEINRDLMKAPHPHCPGRGITEHREHMGWDLDKLSDMKKKGSGRSERKIAAEIKQGIIDKHAPGGEPLTTFGPDGEAHHSWYKED